MATCGNGSKDIEVNGRGWRWKEAGFGISIQLTARDAYINTMG
jgi:hypothetical protein